MFVSDAELRAVFSALRFHSPDSAALRAIPESRWPRLLSFADQAQLTLALGLRAADALPAAVRVRIEQDLARNALRHQWLLHLMIAAALDAAGVPFLLLKGIANSPGYCCCAEHRPQSDIDIYCPPNDCERAAARSLGWEPVPTLGFKTTDHLPVMIRRTGWKWKGDYFDPDMPHSLEIHFRLWDNSETIAAEDAEELIASSEVRDFNGLRIRTLQPADGLTYACIHLVRHFLHGSLTPRHVYEIAHFLEYSANDEAFWQTWEQRQSQTPRRKMMAAIAFRLAIGWFHCAVHPIPAAAVTGLPRPVTEWFELFLWSPATALLRANKDDMWLQLALTDSGANRFRAALRRILPRYVTKPLLDAHIPPEEVSLELRFRRAAYAAHFTASRLIHHTRALLPLVASGFRYWRALRGTQ